MLLIKEAKNGQNILQKKKRKICLPSRLGLKSKRDAVDFD